MSESRLDIVGIGIAPWDHATLLTRDLIMAADTVLYLVPEVLNVRWLQGLNPNCESLAPFYGLFNDRTDVYNAIGAEVLERLRNGGNLCWVLYGHPGVLVTPTHRVVATARSEGFEVQMHPAVSAADCLYADLGVDPGDPGCQMYEATRFLRWTPVVDASAALILWQVGAVADGSPNPETDPAAIATLSRLVAEQYGWDHTVTIYEASSVPGCDPRIESCTLQQLADTPLSLSSTLYVPAIRPYRTSTDRTDYGSS